MAQYGFTKARVDDAEKILALGKKQEPGIAKAFSIAVGQLKSDIEMKALEDAIKAKNLDLAIKESTVDNLPNLLNGIGIDNGELVFSDEVIQTYNKGAVGALALLPPSKSRGLSYSPLGERSVQFMRSYGAIMVRELTDSTREGVNTVLVRGFNENLPPRKQAREIRQLIGLTSPQSEAVINFRMQLEQKLNSPKDNLGNSRAMTPAASRRLSGPDQSAIRGHMKNGNFDQAKIDGMVDKYYKSLQNKRANDIARTEALNAVNNGQLELWNQGLDDGILDPKTVRKFWIVTRDDKLRKSHAAIPIMNPKGVPIPSFFATPFGPVQSPGDAVAELINCRCVLALGGI